MQHPPRRQGVTCRVSFRTDQTIAIAHSPWFCHAAVFIPESVVGAVSAPDLPHPTCRTPLADRRCMARTASSLGTDKLHEPIARTSAMTLPALSFAIPADLFQAAGTLIPQDPAKPDSKPVVRPGCIYAVNGRPVRFKVNIDAGVVCLERVDLDGMGALGRLWARVLAFFESVVICDAKPSPDAKQ